MEGLVIAILSISLVVSFLIKTLVLIFVYRPKVLKCCNNVPDQAIPTVEKIKINQVNAWEETKLPFDDRKVQVSSVGTNIEAAQETTAQTATDSDLETLSFIENEKYAEELARKESQINGTENQNSMHHTRMRQFYIDVAQLFKEIGGPNTVASSTNVSKVDAEKDETCCSKHVEVQQEKRRSDLLKAIKSGDVEQLECAVEWSVFDGYEASLRGEIYEARECLKQRINLDRMRQYVRNMKQSVVSELRSYSKPPKAVHDVMMCVYLLLRLRKEEELKTWVSIQSLMSQGGRNSLKRLIERFRADEVDRNVTDRVKELLRNYDFQHIYEVSEGAAVFYVWILEVIEEVEGFQAI